MKPINPQDRPKVIGLIVGLVLVIGFLAKTFLGMIGSKNHPPAPAPTPTIVASNTPPPAAAPGTATNPATPPKLGLGSLNAIEMGGPTDPFRKVLPDPGQFSGQAAPPVAPRGSKGSGLGGSFPPPVGGGGVVPIDPGKASVPVGPPIKLEGVMADRENYAMVTVGSKTEMYRAGNRIANIYEVLSIDEYGASFRGPSGKFRLEVGQEHTPMATPPPAATGDTAGRLPFPLGG